MAHELSHIRVRGPAESAIISVYSTPCDDDRGGIIEASIRLIPHGKKRHSDSWTRSYGAWPSADLPLQHRFACEHIEADVARFIGATHPNHAKPIAVQGD